MSQTYQHTLLSASALATGSAVTHQEAFDFRTIYISGTFSATVIIEVSPDASGTNWQTVMTKTTTGAFDLTTVCRRIRAQVSAYTSGSVLVQMMAKASL